MSNLIYDSRNQNLHMDRANVESMKTVNVTITTDLASSATPVLLYEYEHGYTYVPQFWGLWDINYMPNAQSTPDYSGLKQPQRRGYGYIPHNTGIGFEFSFYYIVDATYVKLYCVFNTAITPKPNCSGTTAQFTGYVFANDRTSQTYGV